MRRAIVMGKGDLAIRVADWFARHADWQLAHVVPVVPEPSWTGSLSNWAAASNVDLVETGDYRDIPGVSDEAWSVDLAMSVFYDKIVPSWFISRCKRILNIHNGPLPRYRGVSPINWALKNGELSHGVTIHEITPGIDDGPVVAQLEYSIYPDVDEVIDVYRRALAYAWTLFEQTMPILDRIKARPQDESTATYHSADQDPLLGARRGFTRETSEAATS